MVHASECRAGPCFGFPLVMPETRPAFSSRSPKHADTEQGGKESLIGNLQSEFPLHAGFVHLKGVLARERLRLKTKV